MTAVHYTARRSIVPGHSINVQYSLDLAVVEMPITRAPSQNRQQSLDGRRETIRFHATEIYDVTLALVAGGEFRAIKEFLDSVESGEAFTFDPYGSANDPDNPLSAALENEGYSAAREGKRGEGGGNDGYRVSFRVRVIA